MIANCRIQVPRIQEDARNCIVSQSGYSTTLAQAIKISDYHNVQAADVFVEGASQCTFTPCHSLLVCLLTSYIVTH